MDNFSDRLWGMDNFSDRLWGITVQTSYWEGRWLQNCGYTSPNFFLGYGQAHQGKTDLFVKTY